MVERLSHELRAFQGLARAVAAGPLDAPALLSRICAEVREGFALARADVVGEADLAAQHPLVAEARQRGRAVCDGTRVAAPLCLDGRCAGFLIGDRAGTRLDLGETDLQLLTALASVAAVFLEQSDAYGRLQRSLDARSEFVSLASHELRTPIAVVHGAVATLHLRGADLRDGQVRELLATAFEQASRLAELTDQLLDLSRLEAGAVAGRRESIRLRELVDTMLLRLAPDRREDVLVEIAPETELVSAPDALERIVSNLVVNALRYGAPPVRVRASAGGRSELVVEDRGPGIPPELLPSLFERFTRGRRDLSGSGLGLAIARSYAQAIGAELVYESAEPCGARFRLVLPAAAPADVSPPPA